MLTTEKREIQIDSFDEGDSEKGTQEAPKPDEEDVRLLLELRVLG